MEAVDDLLDIMERDPGFAYFHTDSQVSMIDDYLELRPERTEEVKKLVREGRILTGPWYTLPAEFLVNGEALVRNIRMGHEISGKLGKTMKAGYNIFSWGQVSQLPQIYRQFGMDTIIFYRGINQTELDTLEFRWKGADGVEALGLTFGSSSPAELLEVRVPSVHPGQKQDHGPGRSGQRLSDPDVRRVSL